MDNAPNSIAMAAGDVCAEESQYCGLGNALNSHTQRL